MRFMHLLLFFVFSHITLFAMNDDTPKDQCPQLTGTVILPSDARFEKSRLVSNYYASKNKTPKAIVYCHTVDDVKNAVNWARCQNVSVRIRSGGHSHEGFSTGTDALIIDVSSMKNLTIDKQKNTATIQPGVTGGELYSRLFAEGFTQVGGTCEDVGISGLALTGGMGPMLRREGLTCDTLLSFELVNAEGNLIIANKDNEHKDLFWACCGGGGGNFGVVTSLTLKIFPANKVTWFNLGWDWNQPVDKVITAWQDFFLNGDKRWFSHLDLWSQAYPAEKFKKQPIKILGVFYGSPEEAKRELQPLLSIGETSEQTIERVDWIRAIKLFEESTSVYITDKPEYKSSGAFAMKPLPQSAINLIVDRLKKTTYPMLNVLMFSLGGKAAEIAPTDTAYFYRNAVSFLVYSDQWLQENEDAAHIKALDELRESLLAYSTGDYIGNPDQNLKDYLTAYYGGNVTRLREVKRKYDPNNLFRHEQSVR